MKLSNAMLIGLTIQSITWAKAPTDTLLSLSTPDSLIRYENTTSPISNAITWPIENIIGLTIRGVAWPTTPIFEYIQNTEVINRSFQSIRFNPYRKIWFYPFLTLQGDGSSLGIFLLHKSSYLRASATYKFKINRGYTAKFDLQLPDLQKWHLPWLGFEVKSFINSSNTNPIYPPREMFYQKSISRTFKEFTWGIENRFLFNFLPNYIWSTAVSYQVYHRMASSFQNQRIQCNEGFFFSIPNCNEARGISGILHDRSISQRLSRNTVNHPNIPTSGSNIEFTTSLHYTTKNHHFWDWDLKFLKYFLLGTKRYAILPQEKRNLQDLTIKKISKALQYQNFRKEIFNRKVIVTQLLLAHSYEISKKRAPLNALQSIGHDTPLRSFGHSPFQDWSMIAMSAEYRFPIVRLVEGTAFNDYGLVGSTFHKMKFSNIQNSWGFGFRVSRPDLYLFSFQIGVSSWLQNPFITLTLTKTYE